MFDPHIKSKVKLILSLEPLSAKDNMDIDTQLFNSFDKNSIPILRLYHWKKDSCTIGISQKFEDIEDIQKYKNNYAKRITGGGVLFHGNDISYSLLLPFSYMKGLSVKDSYEKICSFLIDFYKELGLNVKYAKDDEKINLSKNQYCQIGFEPYDIVIDGKKIGGNAQRRDKRVIFQHGSIPLKSVMNKKEIGYSLEDFNINLSIEQKKKKILESFQKVFNIEFEEQI